MCNAFLYILPLEYLYVQQIFNMEFIHWLRSDSPHGFPVNSDPVFHVVSFSHVSFRLIIYLTRLTKQEQLQC